MISHWLVPDEVSGIRPPRLSREALWHKVRFIHEDSQGLGAGDVLLLSFDRVMSQRIKRYLYQFSATPTQGFRLVDGGNFAQREPETVLPILEEIRAAGAVVVLLGPPPGFMRYQAANARMVAMVKASNLDDDVFLRQAAPLPMIQYIGTQRHLVSESHSHIDGHLRLSDIREDISLAEPCIRESDDLLFHCEAVSAAEAGYMTGMSASGMTIIEACQLFRYAGAAPGLSAAGIYGYSPEADQAGIMANAIAQMIWYMMEGTTLREDPEKSPLTQYVVQPGKHEQPLLFFKSELSGRWWIKSKTGRKVACSYQDYRRACEEDFTDRVLKVI